MPEGIQDLAEAFAAAASESDSVQSDDVETDEPSVEADDSSSAEHAEPEAGDQPDVAETADEDDLTSLMLEDGPEGEEAGDDAEPAAVDLSSEVTVDLGEGPTTVTIEELRSGYLRQADYTRKTQELAAQRSDLDDAKTFYESFMEDPIGFATALAVRAELIDPNTPVKDTGAIKAQSAEQFEAAVNAEVEKRLAEHPQMIEATKATAAARVHAEFDRIGEAHGMEIPADLRQSILDEAVRRGTPDLELVFEARMARAKERAADKKRAATKRPTASPASAPPDQKEEIVEDIDDAFERALAEVG